MKILLPVSLKAATKAKKTDKEDNVSYIHGATFSVKAVDDSILLSLLQLSLIGDDCSFAFSSGATQQEADGFIKKATVSANEVEFTAVFAESENEDSPLATVTNHCRVEISANQASLESANPVTPLRAVV